MWVRKHGYYANIKEESAFDRNGMEVRHAAVSRDRNTGVVWVCAQMCVRLCKLKVRSLHVHCDRWPHPPLSRTPGLNTFDSRLESLSFFFTSGSDMGGSLSWWQSMVGKGVVIMVILGDNQVMSIISCSFYMYCIACHYFLMNDNVSLFVLFLAFIQHMTLVLLNFLLALYYYRSSIIMF